MAVNDIYKVTSIWTCQSGQLQNVFTYKAASSLANAAEIGEAFNEQVTEVWKLALQTTVDQHSVIIENMASPTDFTTLIPGTPPSGSRTGELAPSTVTASFFAATKYRGIRAGHKSISGLSAADIDGNEVDASSDINDVLDDLAEAFSTVLVNDESTNIAIPIIVKRTKTIVGSKPVYSIPATATSVNHYVADNWAWHRVLGTQVTRKMGRGV